jgi:hypothetical protein
VNITPPYNPGPTLSGPFIDLHRPTHPGKKKDITADRSKQKNHHLAIRGTKRGKRMSLSKAESDIILNRANVALSRSQRLVASWLPQPTPEELETVKTDEQLQKEEDEIFTAVPET